MDKVGMTGTRAQLYNGCLLLLTFFSSRLVYGTYQSWLVFQDVWAAIDRRPPSREKLDSSVMMFATDRATIPYWLAVSYLASNLTLNGLNFYWFVMMIKAIRKRFQPTKGPVAAVEGKSSSSVSSGFSSRSTVPKRRLV